MRPDSASSRRSRWWLLGWGLITLFMMAWAFVLGLFVGQGSLATPEQLASLKEASRAVPGLGLLAKPEPPPPPEQPQPRDLTFYREVERKPDSTAATQTTAAPTTSVSTQTTLSTATTAAPAVTAPPTTVRPPFTPQPFVPPPNQQRPQPFTPQPYAPPGAAAPARPASPPAAQPAPARKGRFTVQVASFKEEMQARELLAQLKASGNPAYLVSTSLEGVGTRYRVRVGPYADLEAAQGAAARIRMQLLLAAYVTREE